MLFHWRHGAEVLCVWGALVGTASALQITQLSPQGEVAKVRQVVAQFDAPAVNFGSQNRPPPLSLSCNDAAATAGQGRWTSDRSWVFDFNQMLPPGVTCTLQVAPGFRSAAGQALSGTQRFAFQTGGPVVRQSFPGDGATIEEGQYFLLRFNGAVAPESVKAHAHCAMDGLGERIAVRLLTGEPRDQLIQARGWNTKDTPADQLVALACQRQLTPSAQVRLVLGKGVATPGGVATRQAQTLNFSVREPFRIEFSCERENAQSACLPLRPMSLRFNTPVTASQALAVRLQPTGAGQAIAPRLENGSEGEAVVEGIEFAPTLAENTAYTVALPSGFVDASGRAPANASAFPLKVATGLMPPLVKFAAAPFGVVERLAEPGGTALLAVTVRQVEPELKAMGLRLGASQVSDLKLADDAEIIAWYQRVATFNDREVSRKLASQWVKTPLPKVVDKDNKEWVDARMLGLLQGLPQVRPVTLPQAAAGDPRPMEVVGIPLQPGFHVLEIASPRLGQSLLDERHGARRTMYVRTSALVTNLGVHFKLGQENALAWVTTLDKGKPVAGAAVKVSDCQGKVVAQGVTDKTGVVRLDGLPARAPACAMGQTEGDDEHGAGAWFVSARAKSPDGVDDLAFTWSDWNRGIESWRFDQPTGDLSRSTLRAHTVLDRALLRAGEKLSMKHFARLESLKGFRLPELKTGELVITHQGSGQEFKQPVAWRKTATGGLSAVSEWSIPPAARLGLYTVQLLQDAGQQGTEQVETAQFRVEEFRLPVLEGQLSANDKKPLIAVNSAPVDLQVNYLSGGGASNLATQVSALLRPRSLAFDGYEGFSFRPPRGPQANEGERDDGDDGSAGQTLVADKLPLTLDKNGRGRTVIEDLPVVSSPQQLLIEASYADPNGETQTLRQVGTLWPAAVVAGIKTEGWVSTRQQARFQALALGIDGQPAANVRLEVRATVRTTTSTRKRLVGGFYSYDNQTRTKELGLVCSGHSDARGLLLCETGLDEAGEVELTATAQDKEGRKHQSVASVYVTRQGELWFGGEDHDRMDLLPEKKRYQPGETARLQVRMPFRFATALVSIEREGIVETRVVQLNGEDPTIELKVEADWGPNVFVSVMALRGRLRDVPWYSAFTWGYKAPREWWNAFWYEGREYVAPTALVDLSKPAYRLGVTELQVGIAAHEIKVAVSTDRESYAVRGKALVTIQATLPNGQPAANAEVALAVVDQALLELGPNPSWDLLAGMWKRRNWSVETATAQMEIIGRRHYGRKAVPAGGGGGHSPTRELFDTLLLWNPSVVLDAKGRATVSVPLNDSLTSFQVVAVADSGLGLFGTGKAQMRTTQDLQIISGLPPLVREGDRFTAMFSLRNTTPKAMQVAVSARATLLDTPPQTLAIPAGETREVTWDVTAPVPLGMTRQEALLWEVQVQDQAGGARDALKASQRIVPAVPITVQQATLAQLDGPLTLPVAPPAGAQADPQGALRGGIRMSLQPTLAEGLPAVREWFANYPFACLEQKTSKSIGLRDAALWQTVVAQLPTYLDADGLASYFPPRDGDAPSGSDTLSAYLLAASHEASALDPAWALPEASRDTLLRGLEGFVQGRVERRFWSPRQDLTVRKLAAIEALSRHGRASARLLQSIDIAPNQWPTHAVIDWLQILKRVNDVPQRAERLKEANQILRARLSYQGTKLVFSTEADDHWWWLMQNGDVNTARLLLAVMDDPAWKDDMGRLASGFIARQQRGTWQTTTANLWGGLALQKFSARFEATPVTGSTRATLGTASAAVDWSQVVRADGQAPVAAGFATVSPTNASPNSPSGPWRHNSATLPWPKEAGTLTATHTGTGKPWVTLQSLAAVDLKAPMFAGYQVKKTITPVEQAVAGRYSRGDILRVKIEVTASTDMTWVVLSDPIPGGASILGSGLGRDSQIATAGEKRSGKGWPVFEERSFEAFRSYYDHLSAGSFKTEYTLRLNNAGSFALPPTRIEAMYAPEVFGELPNARVTVEPVK
ncbi:alpha-2-macroglobulin family protein [Hydrogenophaga sp. A37]|uniref:Ig-like domain-containing alpha-2-macroglobulin family protein n=1 Tax=Hydrogenophaga sp. A37 TaxID=1945864 RepID=UPI00098534B4|nr:Ig-like domain-containing alpha-2-macroglobulin family protein [Hydrogenophaga sp. A37]OOG83793.1 alpha-2-macroglobulin [Hydrogenophaga sp. A37]